MTTMTGRDRRGRVIAVIRRAVPLRRSLVRSAVRTYRSFVRS